MLSVEARCPVIPCVAAEGGGVGVGGSDDGRTPFAEAKATGKPQCGQKRARASRGWLQCLQVIDRPFRHSEGCQRISL